MNKPHRISGEWTDMEDRMHGKRGNGIGLALIAGVGLLTYLAFLAGVLFLAGTGLHAVWGYMFG